MTPVQPERGNPHMMLRLALSFVILPIVTAMLALNRTALFSRRQPGGIQTIADLVAHPGDIYFVRSTAPGAGDTTGHGRSPDAPFATIDYAIGQCTANNGDVIYVLPGHAETVSAAAGIDFDVAGVKVVGLGAGAARPTITMSAVASTIHFDAIGSHLENVLVKVEHDCTIVIDVDKADCVIKAVEFRARTAATAREWVTCIDVAGAGANACDRLQVLDCIFTTPTAGADNCIGLDEVADGVVISGCHFWADCNDAPIHNPTGKVLTNLKIQRCFIANLQTGDHSIELVSACTGALIENYYHNNMTQQTGVDPGSCFSFECYQDDVIDTSAILTPAIT